MVARVYQLVGRVHIVMIDAVREGDHRGTREAPAEAARYYGDEGLSEQTLKVGLLFWVVDPWVLSGVPAFLQAV